MIKKIIKDNLLWIMMVVAGFFCCPLIARAAFLINSNSELNPITTFNLMIIRSGYLGTAEKLPMMSLVIAQIILIALSVSGMIFTVLLIYGGYVWMLARGNSDDAEKGKKIVINAVGGIVLILLSYTISYYIISKLATVVTGGSLNSP